MQPSRKNDEEEVAWERWLDELTFTYKQGTIVVGFYASDGRGYG